MATTLDSSKISAVVPIDINSRPTTTWRFDMMVVGLSIWFMAGLFLDGWAHSHDQVESFFTPWHAVLYSGFMVNAGAVVWAWTRNINRGYPLRMAVPAGYELSVVGAGIFAVGGVLDMLWHLILGVEVNLEALVSPSHLILALGAILFISGPFRAAWRRANPTPATLISYLPMLLSLTFTFSMLTFFTFPLHPFVNAYASNNLLPDAPGSHELYVMLGLAQILLQSGFLMGCVLIAIRRWVLPFGSVTLLLLINTLGLVVLTQHLTFVPVALITGLFADTLIQILRPSPKNPVMLRLFAFATPLVLYLLYFGTLATQGGIWWTVPFWGGASVLAGAVGVLLSYLMVPSASMQTDLMNTAR